MNIAIVGGTGKVGRLVLAGLRGQRVRAFARNDTAAARLGSDSDLDIVRADLDQPETLEPALRDIDVLFIATPFTRPKRHGSWPQSMRRSRLVWPV
ncbi:SDR family oxidoreductase [Streptomyces sp. NPDC057474]|uniref:SDR family oxidoreductase n=1 Tax=Streptomyces sp. NPDC057474 TaxID=3346144 RepID=UPI00368ABB40